MEALFVAGLAVWNSAFWQSEDFFRGVYFKDLLSTFVLVFSAVLALWLVYSSMRRKQQHEIQKALLDKFSSAHDFAEFMQSPAGQKYVMNFADSVASPRNSILKSVQIGIVLLFVGAGFLSSARGNIEGLAFMFGNGFICVGFGFLVSALVSYFISKKLDSKIKE